MYRSFDARTKTQNSGYFGRNTRTYVASTVSWSTLEDKHVGLHGHKPRHNKSSACYVTVSEHCLYTVLVSFIYRAGIAKWWVRCEEKQETWEEGDTRGTVYSCTQEGFRHVNKSVWFVYECVDGENEESVRVWKVPDRYVCIDGFISTVL